MKHPVPPFAILAASGILLAGCTAPAQPTVATFEVAGGPQTYKIELATPELIDHAKRLMAGEDIAAIPIGTIVRDDPSVNEPWSWHIDPATLEFAEITIEVCDGLPEYVEDETLTSPTYCPWSTQVIDITGPGAD
jgi:hypothetical protein